MHIILSLVLATLLTPFLAPLLAAALAGPAGPTGQGRAEHTPTRTFDVNVSTRALVVAPHPDDETVGAGGLMQQVHEAGGRVRVVYLTDGDGYPRGVTVQDHVKVPTPNDYRGYGRLRRGEARNALAAMHLDPNIATFLSFPDGGLIRMMARYWSDRKKPFRSPYTRMFRPPAPDMLLPDAKYRGEDLSQELALVIGTFRPTLIVVTRREDQHADHCAANFFVADALGDVQRVHPEYEVDVINYIVHYNGWPFADDRPSLMAPPGLGAGTSGWMKLPLTAAQQSAKRSALHQYKSQMRVMDWFLEGFARSNEVFSRPAPRHVVLPLKHVPCDN